MRLNTRYINSTRGTSIFFPKDAVMLVHFSQAFHSQTPDSSYQTFYCWTCSFSVFGPSAWNMTFPFFFTRNPPWTPSVQTLKPVLNWANLCSPEHTSDTSANYDSFFNWTFSSPNMVRTVHTLLHSQLACNEMQASARTCGRRAADSMIENVG